MHTKIKTIFFLICTFVVVSHVLLNLSVLQVESNTVNNYSLDAAKVVIFNRIPKCGSSTMSYLLRRLAIKNNFNLHKSNIHGTELITEKSLQSFIAWIFSLVYRGNAESFIQDTIFVKHQHFVPLPKVLRKNVVYVNLMRDPVKRFISGYYYNREGYKKYIDEHIITVEPDYLQYLYQIIRQEWLDKNIQVCGEANLQNHTNAPGQNFKCEENAFYIVKDNNAMQNLKNVSAEWLNKSLKRCVENKSDQECHDFSENRRKKSSLKDAVIKHHAGTDNLISDETLMYPPFMYPTAVPYFCGTDKYCPSARSDVAITQAMKNIDTKFEVVGVTEEMEMSIRVLEAKLPRFFSGALHEYKQMVDEGNASRNKNEYDPPTEEMIKSLVKGLKGEYIVYDHAVKRLQQQYEEVVTDVN